MEDFSIVWHLVLGTEGKDYPGLIARELFYMHGVWCYDGNLCSFCSRMKYLLLRSGLKDNSSCRVVVENFLPEKLAHKSFLFKLYGESSLR